MEIEKFLLDRIRETELDNEASSAMMPDYEGQWQRVRALIASQRGIIAWHKNWPVLVEQPLEFDLMPDDFERVAYKMSQRMAWLTQEEYAKRFGRQPPTAPLLKQMATQYRNRPDFERGWLSE